MKNKLNIFFGLYELWIASRYIRHKNRDSFISFISFTSIIGITLGVMALIIVLSVMNGFQNELKSKILSVASDVEVTGMAYVLRDWQTVPIIDSSREKGTNPSTISGAPWSCFHALELSEESERRTWPLPSYPNRRVFTIQGYPILSHAVDSSSCDDALLKRGVLMWRLCRNSFSFSLSCEISKARLGG